MAMPKTKKSVTSDFLKLRAAADAPIKVGEWHAGFTRVKTYAETNKIPLIAVWSNGDKCDLCVCLEKCFMDPKFIEWQKKSGCIFWFGAINDTDSDDRYQGSGFKWIYQNGVMNTYPFVKLYWPAGKFEANVSGSASSKFNRKELASSKGVDAVIEKFAMYLAMANWKKVPQAPVKPAPAPVTPPPAPVVKEVKKEEVVPEKKEEPVVEPKVDPEPVKEPEPEPKKSEFRVRFNPEWSHSKVKQFRQKIKENDGYCPSVEEKSALTKCVCQKFKDMGDRECVCPCGLFQRFEFKQ